MHSDIAGADILADITWMGGHRRRHEFGHAKGQTAHDAGADQRRCPATDPEDTLHFAFFHHIVDNCAGTADLIFHRPVAVRAVTFANLFDRHAAALRHLFTRNIASERRWLLHAEIEEIGIVPTRLNQMFDKDDIFAPGIQVTDDDDALFLGHFSTPSFIV